VIGVHVRQEHRIDVQWRYIEPGDALDRAAARIEL
jgi:hypothetical protein